MHRRQSQQRSWRTRNKLKQAAARISFAHKHLEMLEARQLLAADVIISEIMFHPSSGDDGQEYVQLYNHGDVNGDTVQIFGADQPEYNGTFVIGGVTNTSFTYTMASAPSATTATGLILSRYLIDHGHSGWHWVSFADGLGKSLELRNPTLSNNDGQNWGPSTPDQGTPGAANSIASANIAPEITNVAQTPLVPKSTDVVTVTFEMKDELATGNSALLHWRVDGAASFTSVSMHDDGLNGDALAGDNIWTGRIPAQHNNTVVEYYISSSDGITTRTYPAPAYSNSSLVQSA